jgi:hypothetical protein
MGSSPNIEHEGAPLDGAPVLSYVFNSVYNQCVLANAYAYRLGDPWNSYNVEQQASIVEDWYTGGHPTSGRAYAYVTDNVRKGDA